MDNGYSNMGNNMNGYNQNMPVGSAPEFTKYLILSIVEMICCCQITGIIGIVFAVMANSAFKIGNMMDYQAKIKNTKTTLLIGLAIGIVCNLLLVLVYGLSFMAGIMEAL